MRSISSFGAGTGVRAINGKTGASQRSRPHDHDEGRDDDGGGDGGEAETPMPQPPGIGRLIDKIA